MKSRTTYRGDTGRKGETGQAAATFKSRLTYLGDIGRKGEAGQAAATIKSISTDDIIRCITIKIRRIKVNISSLHYFRP